MLSIIHYLKIRKKNLPNIKDIIQVKSSRLKKEVERILKKDIPVDILKMAKRLLKGNNPERAMAALLKHAFENESDIRIAITRFATDSPAIKGETQLLVARDTKDQMQTRGID